MSKWLILIVLMAGRWADAAAIDLKEAIEQEQRSLSKEPPDQIAEHKKNLAILYYKDQNSEKAFDLFLEALSDLSPEPPPPISTDEKRLYEEGLQIYLEQSRENMQTAAKTIQKKYQSEISAHPEYSVLGFLMAAAYANLEKFPAYFDRFYQSYRFFPRHYLAYKGKAALHAQLFARRRTISERHQQQELIIQNLVLAVQTYPLDTSLYKMIFVFAPESKKNELINTYLNKIIDENIIISRADIVFYVQQAISIQNSALAERFLNKGREWYQNSRVIDAAQEYIKEKG